MILLLNPNTRKSDIHTYLPTYLHPSLIRIRILTNHPPTHPENSDHTNLLNQLNQSHQRAKISKVLKAKLRSQDSNRPSSKKSQNFTPCLILLLLATACCLRAGELNKHRSCVYRFGGCLFCFVCFVFFFLGFGFGFPCDSVSFFLFLFSFFFLPPYLVRSVPLVS